MKGVIFDLDGTLIDSMSIWDKVDYELLKKYGYIPDEEYVKNITSLTFSEGIDYIIERYGINKTQKDIADELNDMAYHEYANNLILKEGVFEFITKLKDMGFMIAMATSSMRNMCEVVLKRNCVYDLFDAIVFSDEVGKNKTNPDIYIEAAKRIRVLAEDCIVFEDVPYAVEGAKKAGMRVVGVYDEYSDKLQKKMKEICDSFIYSYKEFDFSIL